MYHVLSRQACPSLGRARWWENQLSALWSELLTAVSSTLFAFRRTWNIRTRKYLERQTPGTWLPEVRSTRLSVFQARPKVV